MHTHAWGHNLWAFSSTHTEPNRTVKWGTYFSLAASEQCPGPLPHTCTAQHSKVITNTAYLSLPTSPSPHPPCMLAVIVAQLVLIFFYPVSWFLKVSMNKSDRVPVNVSISYKDWWPLLYNSVLHSWADINCVLVACNSKWVTVPFYGIFWIL